MATWVLGIDEAGYGPNLGPFVMTAVACRVAGEEQANGDLWQLLSEAVRRASDPRDDRLVIDDSKQVYTGNRGLAGLEAGTFVLGAEIPPTLAALSSWLGPEDHPELCAEPWFTGTSLLPTALDLPRLTSLRERFQATCTSREVGPWLVRSVVVCPARFNALVARADSKSAVLGHGFIRLLRWSLEQTPTGDGLVVAIDKQGGRNTYAAQIQQAIPRGLVVAVEENARRSHYRVLGNERSIRLTFQPRADTEHLCVAAASMVSKYLRELCMGEFNAFWTRHVVGLKPTAGYPGDAPRYLEAIRAAMKTLQISEECVWRQR